MPEGEVEAGVGKVVVLANTGSSDDGILLAVKMPCCLHSFAL